MDASRSALVVVDMQNGFCDPEGSIPRTGAALFELDETIAAIGEALDAAHEAGVPVIYTAHCFLPGLTDADPSTRRRFAPDSGHLVRGSWDAEVIPALSPRPGDTVVEKNRFDAFLRTDLERVLADLSSTSLVITGVVTNVCVAATARSAWMRDFEVTVPADTTTTRDAALKAATLAEFNAWQIPTPRFREVFAK